MDSIADVISFATEKHLGQFRKFNGEPYIAHPLRVAKIVAEFTSDINILSAAVLHDTLEDTDSSYHEIESWFGPEVAKIVLSLTNDVDKLKSLGKTVYMSQKMNSLNSDELLIKLADRLDNVSDLSLDNENSSRVEWSKSYATQTDYIISNLSNSFVNDSHNVLIDRIRSKISLFV